MQWPECLGAPAGRGRGGRRAHRPGRAREGGGCGTRRRGQQGPRWPGLRDKAWGPPCASLALEMGVTQAGEQRAGQVWGHEGCAPCDFCQAAEAGAGGGGRAGEGVSGCWKQPGAQGREEAEPATAPPHLCPRGAGLGLHGMSLGHRLLLSRVRPVPCLPPDMCGPCTTGLSCPLTWG